MRQLWLAAVIARLPWLVASAWFGETFLQSDLLLIPALLLTAGLLFLLGKLRPRIQRMLITYSERRSDLDDKHGPPEA